MNFRRREVNHAGPRQRSLDPAQATFSLLHKTLFFNSGIETPLLTASIIPIARCKTRSFIRDGHCVVCIGVATDTTHNISHARLAQKWQAMASTAQSISTSHCENFQPEQLRQASEERAASGGGQEGGARNEGGEGRRATGMTVYSSYCGIVLHPANTECLQRRIQGIKDRRAAKEEKERYAKLAEKMHRKRVERLKRREKRNKMLKS